ncbi:MAG TPA: hypothetical protein ENI23_12025 [bacterium]|nr:hypothetical protein [bacterium]
MRLTKQAIREFQEIYKEEFGKNIKVVEAERLGINLLSLMKAIYKRIPIKEYGEIKKDGN